MIEIARDRVGSIPPAYATRYAEALKAKKTLLANAAEYLKVDGLPADLHPDTGVVVMKGAAPFEDAVVTFTPGDDGSRQVKAFAAVAKTQDRYGGTQSTQVQFIRPLDNGRVLYAERFDDVNGHHTAIAFEIDANGTMYLHENPPPAEPQDSAVLEVRRDRIGMFANADDVTLYVRAISARKFIYDAARDCTRLDQSSGDLHEAPGVVVHAANEYGPYEGNTRLSTVTTFRPPSDACEPLKDSDVISFHRQSNNHDGPPDRRGDAYYALTTGDDNRKHYVWEKGSQRVRFEEDPCGNMRITR